MKKIIFLLTFLFVASFAYAQTSPETYLAQLPAAPANACNLKPVEKASYEKLVRGLKDKMDMDIMQRLDESQIHVDASRNKIASSVAQHPGSVEKITGKSGKTIKEEKKAGSEQVMRQPGVLPAETNKFKPISMEEKTARTPVVSGKVASKIQITPKLQNPTKQAKSIQNMQIEQKALVARIDARKAGIVNRFKTLDQNAAAMKAKEIAPLQRQLASMSVLVTSKEESNRMDQIALKLKNAQKRYCETYSPQYLALLNEYLTAVKASLPDYRRLEEIIANTQLGLDKPIDAEAGLLGIEALRDYTAMLAKVFKYDLPYEY